MRIHLTEAASSWTCWTDEDSPGRRAEPGVSGAPPLGCRSVFGGPWARQVGSGVGRGAAPVLAGDSESALRKERSLFCLQERFRFSSEPK